MRALAAGPACPSVGLEHTQMGTYIYIARLFHSSYMPRFCRGMTDYCGMQGQKGLPPTLSRNKSLCFTLLRGGKVIDF